jgi:hypothetical protein
METTEKPPVKTIEKAFDDYEKTVDQFYLLLSFLSPSNPKCIEMFRPACAQILEAAQRADTDYESVRIVYNKLCNMEINNTNAILAFGNNPVAQHKKLLSNLDHTLQGKKYTHPGVRPPGIWQ